jgi:hypothetical protein
VRSIRTPRRHRKVVEQNNCRRSCRNGGANVEIAIRLNGDSAARAVTDHYVRVIDS